MRTRRLLAWLGLAALPLQAACESSVDPGSGSPEPLDSLPRALAAPEKRLIAASNHFAFGLLREVDGADPSPNVFLSPLSASLALGMASNGARGATLDAMRQTLGFASMPLAEINRSYRGLADLLRDLDPAVQMHIGNSVWARQGYPFHDAFFQAAKTYFDAEAATLDFADPRSAERINAWVDRSTRGKIGEIVERIDPNVVMYLINAIYFKGSWQTRFDARLTRDAPFTRADGTRGTVKMMHLPHAPVRAAELPAMSAVELPYGSGAFVMTVVLPAEGGSLDALVEELDAEAWEQLTGQLEERRLDVFLPRFRLEYEQVLNDPLKALGMEVAFGPGADFSGLSPNGEGLYISEVRQKTYVEVNEEGTEAAAVTSVAIAESLPPSFRVDRPFLVAIRERFSGAILFLGKVTDPK